MFITYEPVTAFYDIFKRFGKVFEQSYTRFIDLQKAEAQAREAQIELSLERVRTRAMGMQNSNELAELVNTVFKELTQLDFELGWCMINIIDAPSLSNTVWTINAESGKIPESFHMKFEDYPFHDAMMKGYKERATKYIYVLEGIEKKEYDEYLFNDTEFRNVPEEARPHPGPWKNMFVPLPSAISAAFKPLEMPLCLRRILIFSSALEKYSTLPIPASMICYRPKPRPGKRR